MTEPVRTVLHGFFRSTASYRVRIALNLKGIAYEDAFYNLGKGEHRTQTYLARNPQGLLPALDIDDKLLTQSLAICEYLDETRPKPPLLPADPAARARIRMFAQIIACDVHPVQNLKVLNRLRQFDLPEDRVKGWAAVVISEGLDACDQLLTTEEGPYCFGASVTLADLCLVPQLINARRFGVDMCWPRLAAIEEACLALSAFQLAAPENQADAA